MDWGAPTGCPFFVSSSILANPPRTPPTSGCALVYFVVGLLAAQAAFTSGGKTTDTSGALQEIITQPFGKFLLSIVAIGLIGYTCWRFVQTVLDPEHRHEDEGAKAIGRRFGYAFSTFAYGGLTLTALSLIFGWGSGGGDGGNSTQDWTARILAQPFGQWLVGLGGVATIGVGAFYLYQALKAKFMHTLKQREMSAVERKWAKRAGQLGIAARGIVFGVIGIFFIVAAWKSDAREVKGLGGALAALAQQPYGSWLLGLVALGLIAYSIYSLVEARYRQLA
ncbi:MAG TPA: DUF1206 domain-containing protein [Leptolyngbyaceae cyanobacterium M33_DOE_097]|uniref:DUF1206 domain-containing protein n=1 Tax=Oscillatoriales cyanobacterium SpSt-418 TaxID=2282169 RepID=A0A7C3PSR6_9CYAN|nr:DUF1206 domain-containing protein [Leptolyngbyaceae cyanobacterium M33_DOE_097]